MAIIQFQFDAERTAEAILFLAQRFPQPTFLALAKLLYFADKTSLESYGRSITGDSYYAMQHGPVPSGAYDMMKAAKDTHVYGFHVDYERTIVPDRDPNLSKLSSSDVKCLEQVIAAYQHYPVWQLRELSHDEAWQKAWARVGNSQSARMSIGEDGVTMLTEDIVAAVDEDDELLEFLKDTHKPQREPDRQ